MEDYQIDFYRIRKREDIKRVQRGQMCSDYQSAYGIKKEMKKTVTYPLSESHVDFDESDAITNGSSKRTKAMLLFFENADIKCWQQEH